MTMIGRGMEQLKEMLIKHEGLRLKPYEDTAGKLTIGVGRNLDDVGITTEEAYWLLEHDIVRSFQQAESSFPWFWDLDSVRQDVIVSMIFNLGLQGFSKFRKTIDAIKKQSWNVAADEMLNSRWAKQVKSRSTELAELMRTGSYK